LLTGRQTPSSVNATDAVDPTELTMASVRAMAENYDDESEFDAE